MSIARIGKVWQADHLTTEQAALVSDMSDRIVITDDGFISVHLDQMEVTILPVDHDKGRHYAEAIVQPHLGFKPVMFKRDRSMSVESRPITMDSDGPNLDRRGHCANCPLCLLSHVVQDPTYGATIVHGHEHA